MILAMLVAGATALVPPGKQLMVTVDLQPAGAGYRVARLDPAMLRHALVRELQAAGVAVGASPDLPRLVVHIGDVDPGEVLALSQRASIAAAIELVQPGEPGRPETRTALAPASCTGSAKFGLLSTPGQRARLALARCIDQLAGEITARVTGNGEAILVR